MSDASAPDRADTAASYSRRLQDIGRHLDAQGFHALTIIEVEDGLLVRASRAGSRAPELIEVPNGDVLPVRTTTLGRQTVPRRLFPQGYAPFLAALGARLDVARAAAISIVEATDFVVVGGIQLVSEGPEGRAYEPLDLLLLPADIQALLAAPPAGQPARLLKTAHSAPARPPVQAESRGIQTSGLGDAVLRLTHALRSPIPRFRH